MYKNEQLHLEKLNSMTKEQLIETILKKESQIDRLKNKVGNNIRYIDKLKKCVYTLKQGDTFMSAYSQHWFTNPDRIE